MTWPPPEMHHIYQKISEWDAWLTGDRARLEAAYESQPATYSGFRGFTVRLWRRFWGEPVTDPSAEPRVKVHVPLAADIARASADLLFSDPPSVTSEDTDTQTLIDGFLENGLINVCANAAEVAAGLGGVYLRALPDFGKGKIFTTRVDYDCVAPTFVFGELVKIIIWRNVATKGRQVWRHFETHELDSDGIGIVRHQLFSGTVSEKGVVVPLTDRVETAPLADILDEGDYFSTQSPGLAVQHFPNATLNTLWRTDPIGCHLGQADIAGAEPELDRLDHAKSAELREVDLGVARIIIPTTMLDVGRPGEGVSWDRDREIWSPVNTAPTEAGDMEPKLVQPDIRVEKYHAVQQQLTEEIIRHAGYSAQTFGEDENGAEITATQVNSQGRRSDSTKGRKIRVWQPGLERYITKMVAMSVAIFGVPGDPETVQVQFPDGGGIDLLTTSQAVQAADIAGAVSTPTKVRLMHPDWGQDQIDEEVALIKAEKGLSVEDPAVFGQGGYGLPDIAETAEGEAGE